MSRLGQQAAGDAQKKSSTFLPLACREVPLQKHPQTTLFLSALTNNILVYVLIFTINSLKLQTKYFKTNMMYPAGFVTVAVGLLVSQKTVTAHSRNMVNPVYCPSGAVAPKNLGSGTSNGLMNAGKFE
jgi:hypothetical protein